LDVETMSEEQADEKALPLGIVAILQGVAVALVAIGNVLARLSALLAIVCLIALLLLVLVQTAMGKLSGYFPDMASAMSVSWEYAGYLMGVAFMLGMAQTLRLGGHIRVSLLFDALRPSHRRVADFVASAAAFAITATLAASLTTMAVRAFATNSLSTASLTPLWIPTGAFALGACLFAFQLFIRMVALLAGLPPEEERAYVGAPSE
jgi:TRAP-type C4-dicarboxylate transport system permease small subunit